MKKKINEEVSQLQKIAGVVKELGPVNNLGERTVSVPEEQWMDNFEDELMKQLMVKSPRAYQTVTRAMDHMDIYDNYSDGGTQNDYAKAVKEVVQDVFFAMKNEGGQKPEEEGLTTELNLGSKDRMNGLVNQKALEAFKTSIGIITKEMYDDGFDLEDVKEYLMGVLDEKFSQESLDAQINKAKDR